LLPLNPCETPNLHHSLSTPAVKKSAGNPQPNIFPLMLPIKLKWSKLKGTIFHDKFRAACREPCHLHTL
jgi:hypothetical protein